MSGVRADNPRADAMTEERLDECELMKGNPHFAVEARVAIDELAQEVRRLRAVNADLLAAREQAAERLRELRKSIIRYRDSFRAANPSFQEGFVYGIDCAVNFFPVYFPNAEVSE
jgi:chromosome segregation ATPase